jgi:hypothetical protein
MVEAIVMRIQMTRSGMLFKCCLQTAPPLMSRGLARVVVACVHVVAFYASSSEASHAQLSGFIVMLSPSDTVDRVTSIWGFTCKCVD